MAMSKPASEQELAEKRRRELKVSTILTEFAKRHRRKIEASRFLLKLEGPLDTTEALAQAAGISSPNGCAISATDSSGKVGSFFKINAINKTTIEAYLRAKASLTTFVPTFIPCKQARKSLSPHSRHPTLGIETTLPHRRLEHLHDEPRPAQNEYPVWYFVYGDLAEGDVLFDLLGCGRHSRNSQVVGGILKRRGEDWVLLNDPNGIRCMPWLALLVETKGQEDMLRVYQTDTYEALRCTIGVWGEATVAGLTF
ncbi:hypothetical protein Focb16_v003711 [Fusarium oxysporum f. sp. cubense]|uniref:Gamma-glutamylcyclotransferase AIG2-like domain-containing protein n=1 Tax=Fusarium oxysporum f. sp. cubense TaxID=61366 RepID=A0A559KMC6_FUSOC|nr:hypothetical protein Focb16_v003711 [Fusarium oxysporum f. sp. cubense]